ncbi:unnamed protein product, partial [Symbiodinium sp. CCMP2456]
MECGNEGTSSGFSEEPNIKLEGDEPLTFAPASRTIEGPVAVAVAESSRADDGSGREVRNLAARLQRVDAKRDSDDFPEGTLARCSRSL